ncbi:MULTISPECIES: SDR family oxidoreductase [unclassified Rubrivivax]|uniref:SDR family oxidoreductase n=1 Tax=unclassified Rubrivivax TaxID=2649762 RepID=UPI001E388689|nr:MULTISPECIES: SDR family oxidoreductase [unclassified Rubrivivax]MCC9597790.1 SDR family oxidoreductase [Rubrivivax sp. JA1055]MCC9645953.1 SDR family oxidoreductase [Rubrivivax sp. JA1029]
MKIDQTRVVLTGAAGGIGRAMVQALAEQGAAVLGVGRGASGPGNAWQRADLATPEGRQAVVQAAGDWNANVVVHAAGVPAFGALAQVPAAQVEQVLQTNLLAPMLLTQALLPQLQRQPRAQIVFVGSVLGRIGLPGFSVYGASKAGLHGFAEALRRELGDGPVRVQTLAPRSTRTAFNDAAAQAYNVSTGAASDTPELVAQALLQLIESEAPERTLGGGERVFARLNGLLGAWMDSGFSKHRRSLPAAAPTQGQTR